VQGIVKLDGQPLGGAMVVYAPVDEQRGQSASGLTKSDGTFELKTPDGKTGALPGEYKVVVSHSEVSALPSGQAPDPSQVNDMMKQMKRQAQKDAKTKKSPVPSKYRSAKTTPFNETVPPKGKIVLELQSE